MVYTEIIIPQRFTLMSYRTFRSPEGAEWTAWCVTPDGVDSWNDKAAHFLPSGMSAGWLCFESGEDKRRLTPVPVGWAENSDAELWALCGTAQPVKRRGPATPPSG